jgi:hypothetical protein
MNGRSEMARYFFHVRDGRELIPDPEGVDISNLEAAADDCRSTVQEVLNEDASQAELASNRQFEITDEQGGLCLVIPFLEVPMD